MSESFTFSKSDNNKNRNVVSEEDIPSTKQKKDAQRQPHPEDVCSREDETSIKYKSKNFTILYSRVDHSVSEEKSDIKQEKKQDSQRQHRSKEVCPEEGQSDVINQGIDAKSSDYNIIKHRNEEDEVSVRLLECHKPNNADTTQLELDPSSNTIASLIQTAEQYVKDMDIPNTLYATRAAVCRIDVSFGNAMEKASYYKTCQLIFRQINSGTDEVKCFYRIWLLATELKSPEMMRGEANIYMLKLFQGNTGEDILKAVNEILLLATRNQPHHSTFLSEVLIYVYQGLGLILHTLFQKNGETAIGKQSKQQWEFVLLEISRILLFKGQNEEVCHVCKAVNKENPQQDEALYLWSLALRNQSKLDVALKKADLAFNILQNRGADTQDIGRLRTELLEDLESSMHHKNDDIDKEWLIGTNVSQTDMQMRKQIQKKVEHKQKKKRSRPHRVKHERNPVVLKQTLIDEEQEVLTHNRDVLLKISTEDEYPIPIFKDSTDQKPDKLSLKQNTSESNVKLHENHVSEESFQTENKRNYPSKLELKDNDDKDEDEEDVVFTELSRWIENGIELSHSCVQSFSERKLTNDQYNDYNDKIVENIHATIAQNPNFKHCTFQINSAHKALCKNIDKNDPIQEIEICGRRKCGKAFNDDEVLVEVIGKQKENQHTVKSKEQNCGKNKKDYIAYGKIKGTIKRKKFENIDHPVFICKIDKFRNNLMIPLCNTVPKLHVKHHKKGNTNLEIYDYQCDTKTLRLAGTISLDAGNKHAYVFIVLFVRWDGYYPRGVVLKALDTSSSIKNGLDSLKLLHCVPAHHDSSVVKRAEYIVNEMSDNKDREDFLNLDAFTIDCRNSEYLDDALSIEFISKKTYSVGIHIADVSVAISKNDIIDKEAQRRAVTFYTGGGFKASHMLPKPLRESFSLQEGEIRKTLSLFFTVEKDMISTKVPIVHKSVIRSKQQFSYRNIQDIIMGKPHSLSKSICTLFKIAKKMRKERIGDQIYCTTYPSDELFIDEDEIEEAREAHILVEEFMILANMSIGNFLLSKFPDVIPVRCQEKPNLEKLQEWATSNELTKDVVLRLRNINIQSTIIDKEKDQCEKLPFQKWVWKAIEDAIKSNKLDAAIRLICCDELHPEHALTLQEWFKVQEKGQYICIGDLNDHDAIHFSLSVKNYTHFTSPIRRFVDLAVHRLVHAALNGEKSPYSKEEITSLCETVNATSRRAKLYKEECKTFRCGKQLLEKPEIVNGFVENISEADISFLIPGKLFCRKLYTSLSLSHLFPDKRPLMVYDRERRRDQLNVKWERRIYSFSGYAPNVADQRRTIRTIDPDQNIVFLKKKKWLNTLQKITTEKLVTVDELDMSKSCETQINSETDVASENASGKISNQTCNFQMNFYRGQVISVQYTAESRNGLLVPVPQILDMTNNVKFCIQHRKDPVHIFEQYATKHMRDIYKSCDEYLEVILPLLRMEAAKNSTHNMPACINDLPVSFDETGGKFILLMSFCEQRYLDFSSNSTIMNLSEEDDEDEKIEIISSSDYLCIRTNIQDGEDSGQHINTTCSPHQRMIWVGHGKIEKIRKLKKKGMIEIYFKLTKNSMKPFLHMQQKEKSVQCCIEIIWKAEVDKRADAILQKIATSSSLAKEIALNIKPRICKEIVEIANQVELEPDMYATTFTPIQNNDKQNEAIQTALCSNFTLIQGPPGTGKTFTGVKLVSIFCKMNRMSKASGSKPRQLLFCGPSNKSVDLVAKWVIRMFGEHAPSMVRIYGSSMENKEFPIPGRIFSNKAKSCDGKPDQELTNIALHHLIRSEHNKYAEEIKHYDRLIRQNPTFSNVNEIQKYKTLLSSATKEELKLYEVIFCTTDMATNYKLVQGTRGRIFQIIIDEAGMCTEPECIAAITATQAKQVVLIGDHKQLRPTILCKEAGELGLEKSLFERYSDDVIMLNVQYRMHPEICKFPSRMFYKGRLQTDMIHKSAWFDHNPLRCWPNPKVPYLFCHIVGEEEAFKVTSEDGNEFSRRNLAEVAQVVKIVKFLLDIERISPKRINIMSQYNAQRSSIKSTLTEEGYINLNINTVVASQGSESDYVILSTVRSLPLYKIETKPSLGWCKQNLGFITDAHQINVALTRAKKGLIIVGNKNLLKCETRVWGRLLQQFEKEKCVVDENYF